MQKICCLYVLLLCDCFPKERNRQLTFYQNIYLKDFLIVYLLWLCIQDLSQLKLPRSHIVMEFLLAALHRVFCQLMKTYKPTTAHFRDGNGAKLVVDFASQAHYLLKLICFFLPLFLVCDFHPPAAVEGEEEEFEALKLLCFGFSFYFRFLFSSSFSMCKDWLFLLLLCVLLCGFYVHHASKDRRHILCPEEETN